MLEKNKAKGIFTALEIVGAIVFIFGVMWQGAESLALEPQQWMMLYGLIDVLACEIIKRTIDHKFPEPEPDEGSDSGREEEESDR